MTPFAQNPNAAASLRTLLDAVTNRLVTNQGDSQRLFHGRGKTYTGLEFITIDLYSPVLLITLFREPTPEWHAALIDALLKTSSTGSFDCIAVQRRQGKNVSLTIEKGELPAQLFAQERGLRYKMTLGARQNTGFFLDMQPGREWLRDQAAGKNILNLFAYSCSFSVASLAGNARQVVNIDMSGAALETGKANHFLNFPAQVVAEKAIFKDFEILRSIGWIAKRGPFDIVVIDPPSYQPGSFIAAKDYPRLIKRLSRLVKEGSLILSCLNARNLSSEFLRNCFAENFSEARFVRRLESSPDFADIDVEQSLKLMLFRVREETH